MKLLLTSSGITNMSIENALLGLLGKPFRKSNITFVPTAANVEEGNKSWLVDDMYNFKKLEFATFDIIDIAAVPKEIWLPSFTKADIIVFGGGNTQYLRDWIEKSGLEKELPDLLKTRVYVGISAGSMVTAKKISLSYADILYYEKTGKFQDIDGLGFVDFEIRPHLNSDYFEKVKIPYLEEIAGKNKNTFYALDDNSAIKVENENISVISEGEWKKFN